MVLNVTYRLDKIFLRVMKFLTHPPNSTSGRKPHSGGKNAEKKQSYSPDSIWSASSQMMRIKAVTRLLHSKNKHHPFTNLYIFGIQLTMCKQ